MLHAHVLLYLSTCSLYLDTIDPPPFALRNSMVQTAFLAIFLLISWQSS